MRGLLGVMMAGLLAGCASTGYQRAEKAATGLRDTRAEVVAARQQVAHTIDLLDQMVNAPQGDLRPLYQQLTTEVKAVEKAADRSARRADAFRRDANAYVTAWADELETMQSAEMRTLSTQRRADAMKDFGAIEQAASASRTAYAPLLTHLQGITQHLGQDLTAGGVAALQPKVEQAKAAGRELQSRISVTLAELDRVADALAPSTQ